MSGPELSLDPTRLDPEALPPATYHKVVGPALQVAAEVAAARGDPTLHADMPAMLALVELVTALAERWCAEHADEPGSEPLAGAAAAACVMVMQQAKLPETAIGQCLAALETAYAQLAAHAVTAPATPMVNAAWQAFEAGERGLAVGHLKRAAECIVAAIEAWQARVH